MSHNQDADVITKFYDGADALQKLKTALMPLHTAMAASDDSDLISRGVEMHNYMVVESKVWDSMIEEFGTEIINLRGTPACETTQQAALKTLQESLETIGQRLSGNIREIEEETSLSPLHIRCQQTLRQIEEITGSKRSR